MKLSLDQYLRLLDFEVVDGLAATLSSREKKERLWAGIQQEEDRVAGLKRDFTCDIVVKPRMPFILFKGGMVSLGGVKLEGELERRLEEEKFKLKPGMLKFWPFYKGSIVPHST